MRLIYPGISQKLQLHCPTQPRPKIILVTSPPLPPLLGLCVLGRWAVEVFSFFMKIAAIGGGGVWGWQMSS